MFQMIQRHRKSNKANDISFLGKGAIFEGEPIYVLPIVRITTVELMFVEAFPRKMPPKPKK